MAPLLFPDLEKTLLRQRQSVFLREVCTYRGNKGKIRNQKLSGENFNVFFPF